MTITDAEHKLHSFYTQILEYVENTSKSEEDSILLAGAMMSVARILYFDNLVKKDAGSIMEHNTIDFIELIKPTIH
jgi:hypothetical protein